MSNKIVDALGVNLLKIYSYGAAAISILDSVGDYLATRTNPLYVKKTFGGTLVGEYACSTFRSVGAASSPQNLASIENPVGSGIKVAVRRLTVQTDSTTLLATTATIKSGKIAIPSGGTIISSTDFDSAYPAAKAIVRGLASADGTNGTVITATLGNVLWSQVVDRAHTLAGWFLHEDQSMIPQYAVDEPIILAEGEALLIQVVGNTTTGQFFVENFSWEEYT